MLPESGAVPISVAGGVANDLRLAAHVSFFIAAWGLCGLLGAPTFTLRPELTNGHGTARGVARLYDALLQPGLLLSTELLSEAVSPQSEGFCPILHEEVTFGLGFKPTVPRRPFGPNPHSFGHFGTGGAIGFADPDARVAFGYVMNHVIPRWQSTRNRALIDAVYAAL